MIKTNSLSTLEQEERQQRRDTQHGDAARDDH